MLTTQPTKDLPVLLKKLIAEPSTFDEVDAEAAVLAMVGTPSPPPVQIGAFLTALKLCGLEASPKILVGCANALLQRSCPVEVENSHRPWVDIVGTGGDGHDAFNASTAAGIVAAGAGARVIKHGNKASTSASGSADILKALGCGLPPPTEGLPIRDQPFTYLLASHYHPAMAAMADFRKQLPFRTIFNILGPLINPSRPNSIVLGVANPTLGPVFADCLRLMGVQSAMVVCGFEGLDEISIAGPTHVWDVRGDLPTAYRVLSPEDFGLAARPLSLVCGGSPKENAHILTEILAHRGAASDPLGERASAARDFALINASALLTITGSCKDFKTGVTLAQNSLISGDAQRALDGMRSSK